MLTRITLQPHTDLWKIQFEKESVEIKEVFGSNLLDIQHIGSTSIPDLLSKPIIDIAVRIALFSNADKFIKPLGEIGYVYKPEMSSTERHFFQKGNPIQFHLSISYDDRGGYWKRQILFRDYLRNNTEARREYESIKFKGLDKSAFVQKILLLAKSK
jgi:GrpB-like predicted nucleotidyltransferase (UPF0157 family)